MTDPAKSGSPLHPFSFNGAQLVAHVSGALLWPSERLLVVSDLHLEKGAAFASAGTFLPPYDTAETLDRLEALIAATKPETVISLGDSFHNPAVIAALAEPRPSDASGNSASSNSASSNSASSGGGGTSASSASLLARIRNLTASVGRFVWVTGNHDPDLPSDFGGEVREDFDHGVLHFRHEASPLFAKAGEVSGHWHPKASIRSADNRRALTRPCFIHDQVRLILPAFGAFTGRLTVFHPAIVNLFSQNSVSDGTGLTNCAVYLMGRHQIAAVKGNALLR